MPYGAIADKGILEQKILCSQMFASFFFRCEVGGVKIERKYDTLEMCLVSTNGEQASQAIA